MAGATCLFSRLDREVGALAKIREIMECAKQAKIAVAFWGRGAVQRLGLERLDLEAEVICNLD